MHTGCDGTIDLAFVVDTSGSIRNERFPQVLQFLQQIIEKYDVSENVTRVALVSYSSMAELRFPLDRYYHKNDVMQAVEWLPFTPGATNIANALSLLRTSVYGPGSTGDRDTAPNIAVLVTDGRANVLAEMTIPEAIQSRVDGIHLIVVALETDPNDLEIKGIASDPDSSNVIAVPSYKDLPKAVDSVVKATCNGTYTYYYSYIRSF